MEGNKFTVVAFYTIDTPYEKVFYDKLFPSLKKWNLPWSIHGVHSLGNWNRNVALKPKIILECLKTGYIDNIVALDVDCTIEKYPDLFHTIPEDVDLAAHWLDWQTWYQNGNNRKEFLSGTLFLRKNDKVKKLVTRWAEEAEKTAVWEQKVLEKLLEGEFKDTIKTYPLPIEYCYIKTLPNGNEPFVKCDPVIVHHQASREFKRSMK